MRKSYVREKEKKKWSKRNKKQKQNVDGERSKNR